MAASATVNDLLDGHVVLDLQCLDRIYLNGYVPNLQVGGQVVSFMTKHLGNRIPSPAIMEKIGTRFRQDVKAFAEKHSIPVVRFGRDDRKVDMMRSYLDAQAATGASGVAAIGVAQEFQNVFAATGRATPSGIPWYSFNKADRRVTCFYFYLWDNDFGPAFIKICTYFPYPIKVWVNGHEWAKRQASAAGIGFTALSNGFATCTDPAALQDICDRLGPGTIGVFFQRWMSILPVPLTEHDRTDDYWWELSMRQVETSRTLVFDAGVHARAFFESLLRENMDLGRPENAELLFRRGQRLPWQTNPPPGGFKTKIDQYCELVTMNVFYKSSRLKQYLKDGTALRIETVINSPKDLRVNRRLENLPELQGKARAVNAFLLETETAGQDTVLVSPVIERITRPTVTDGGRKAPALRFGDLRVQALAGAIAAMLFAVTGITNRSLRALMTGLLHRPYSMNQASYDLSRLARNGLITTVPGRNRYTLTREGLLFAHIYTKVYDHVLRPLMAPDRPNAPPELAAALDTLDQLAADHIARARVPTAA